MTTLYITEFSGLLAATGTEKALKGTFAPVPMLPGTTQAVVFGPVSVQCAALQSNTKIVRLHAADAPCHVMAGPNPTCTTSHMRLSAGQTEYFGVASGDLIAVLAGV